MYAMRDIKKVVRFLFSAEGIQIREQACQENLFIFASFKADRFRTYKTTGEGVICFLPEYLYVVLANHSQRDEVAVTFNHKKDRRMLIEVFRDGNENIVQRYELPLLLLEDETLQAEQEEVDYLLAFDTNVITNIFSCLIANEKDFAKDWVLLTCEPKKVVFEMTNGFSISRARFTLLTDRGKEYAAEQKRTRRGKKPGDNSRVETNILRSVHQNTVALQFRLKYIQQLMKCFSINRGSILVYIKQNYPIIFEIKVGMLGDLRLTLMTRNPRDTSDDEEEDEVDEDVPLVFVQQEEKM